MEMAELWMATEVAEEEDSRRQMEEHPSPLERFPSSHSSVPVLAPSPHLALQMLGFPEQDQPCSTRHRSEQPSNGLLLESSHCSVPAGMPSPQVVEQRLGTPEHCQPASTVQMLHPSNETALASSHCSRGTVMPSPQATEQRLGVFLHIHPCSTTQAEEHPSPLIVLPSSHVSLPMVTTPSPQGTEHREGNSGEH
jgi:hypothetical protein